MKRWLLILACLLAMPAMAQSRRVMATDADPSGTIRVSVPPEMRASTGDIVVVPVHATQFEEMFALDLGLAFDGSVLRPLAVEGTALTEPWLLVYNVNIPNVVYVAMYGIYPLSGSGDILRVTFQVVGGDGAATLVDFNRCWFDENRVPCEGIASTFTVGEWGNP